MENSKDTDVKTEINSQENAAVTADKELIESSKKNKHNKQDRKQKNTENLSDKIRTTDSQNKFLINTEKRKTGTQLNLVNPFIYTNPSISVICIRLFILLALQIIMLGVTKSFSALEVVAVSFAGAVCASALNYLIFKEPMYNCFPIIIQGLLIGLFLPESYPLVTTFFIVFVVIFISRCMIFKSVNSWVNVSALAVIVAWFIGCQFFPGFLVSQDMITIKNPSVYMIQNGTFNIYGFDSTITQFLNSMVFRFLKVNLPDGFISMLWDTHSSIPAFRFNLLTIFASIVLISDYSLQPVIPALFLLVYGTLVRLFAPVFFGGTFNSGDVILALLSSGTLFTSIFMLQWFGTTPITMTGKIIFAILGGIVAFFIVGCGTSPIGMCYTVLVCNMINMMIRFFEEKYNKVVLRKVLAKTLNSNNPEKTANLSAEKAL